ncbi:MULTISPECIES: maleylpyruvate isomerase family mycothiol-dependent enzyme [unclassified Streptomyces]|uniref:maleylpyruvate isomerase family mycothiol-dependent enzyme n=1 Tax=unclassified Streptomyces TaxID=2593676 RepID=UPI003D8FF4DD
MNPPPAPLPLASDTLLAALSEEVAAFEQLLRTADTGTPVATCGDWNLRGLGAHLGQVYRFAAVVVRTGALCREQFAPADAQQIADWYAEGAASLLAALRETDPAASTWAFGRPDAVAAFWFRRLTMETAVHLLDAQLATGAEIHVNPLIAADGVDEVFATLMPMVWSRGEPKLLPAPVALRTTDTGHGWLIQPADIPQVRPVDSMPPAATVAATAADLLLTLWKRRAPKPEWINGDVAAANALLTASLTL